MLLLVTFPPGKQDADVTSTVKYREYLFQFTLLMLAGQLSDCAFRIPFYQQLSSKNSLLLPTWSTSWEGSKSSNQGWKFHDPLESISELLLARI